MQIVSDTLPQRAGSQRTGGLWALWKQRWLQRREDAKLRAELRYELRCLDEAGELEGALAQIGLSRAAIPELLRLYPGSVRRYGAMTGRLGVRPPSPRAGLVALVGSRRRCLFCAETARCDRWLASDARRGNEEFCPNAGTFEAIKKRA
ncbi:MAG: hypothetical protein JNM29_04125 [Candidatus Odyssella sp.]|nr:hypothetical protein [Candidatus Odyssella sp.]